jgi:hemerythrin-like domain-containing protein
MAMAVPFTGVHSSSFCEHTLAHHEREGRPMVYKTDLTMMYATHDALRRDLDAIIRITASDTDDPRVLLRSAVGWQLFKKFLHVHHCAEDDLLWPAMRRALVGDEAAEALLDAMQAEHARIDPLLTEIDAALGDRGKASQRLGELTETLASALHGHLDHEEIDVLPLIDSTVSEQEWGAFGAETGKRVGEDIERFFPWALESATPQIRSAVLGVLPPPMLHAYRDVWQPAYADLALWPTGAVQ